MGEKIISLSKKISLLMKNPRHQKKWRGAVGVAFIGIFVLFTVVFDGSQIALALKNSGYGYGYGYSGTATTSTVATYGYGYQYSDYVPSAVTGVTYSVGSTTATLNWTYPTTTVGSTSLDNPSGTCYTYGTSLVQTCTAADNFVNYSVVTASISSLTAETLYYYVIQAYDDNNAYGTAYTGTFTTLPTSTSTTTTSGGGGGIAIPDDVKESVGEKVDGETGEVTAEIAVPKLPAERDLALEKAAIIEMRDFLGFLPSTDDHWKMIQYIAYGAGPGSAKLSPRDRRGVLGDFYDTYGYYPSEDGHWIDIELILTSHKPKNRNLDKERYGIDEFVKIYKRLPDWANVYDDWAVSYISYKIRNVGRNLDSERAGIASFRSVYNRIPVSSQDWATTRAITYSGASR